MTVVARALSLALLLTSGCASTELLESGTWELASIRRLVEPSGTTDSGGAAGDTGLQEIEITDPVTLEVDLGAGTFSLSSESGDLVEGELGKLPRKSWSSCCYTMTGPGLVRETLSLTPAAFTVGQVVVDGQHLVAGPTLGDPEALDELYEFR